MRKLERSHEPACRVFEYGRGEFLTDVARAGHSICLWLSEGGHWVSALSEAPPGQTRGKMAAVKAFPRSRRRLRPKRSMAKRTTAPWSRAHRVPAASREERPSPRRRRSLRP